MELKFLEALCGLGWDTPPGGGVHPYPFSGMLHRLPLMIRLSSDTVLKISNLNSWLREILSVDADELSNKEVLRKLKAESQFFPAGTWEPTVTAEIYSVMVPKD